MKLTFFGNDLIPNVINRNAYKRLMALFLCLIFVFSIQLGISPVYAGSLSNLISSDTMPGNAPPLKMQNSKTVPSQDINTSGQSGLKNINSLISAGAAGSSDALQSTGTLPKTNYYSHTLDNLTTPYSKTIQNKDGTLTTNNYVSPQFYKINGKWNNIDTSLIPDTNSADSGNFFGKALGSVEAKIGTPTAYTVKANSWQARFANSKFEGGMVRIKDDKSQIGYSPNNSNDVDPVISKDSKGQESVTYSNLWNGVDVVYNVFSNKLKESIVLHDRSATSNFSFKIINASLSSSTDSKDPNNPNYDVKSGLNEQLRIGQSIVLLNKYGPDVARDTGLTETYSGDSLNISLGSNYINSLPSDAFPAVIDPTTYVSPFGTSWTGNYESWGRFADGRPDYLCSLQQCDLYAGKTTASNGSPVYWRGFLYSPYDVLNNSNIILNNATLHLTQQTGRYWYGYPDARTYYVGHAYTTNSWDGIVNLNESGTVSTSGDINVTDIYNALISNKDWGGWLGIDATRNDISTWKSFDPNYSYVSFTYSNIPSAPTIASPSVNNQVFVDPQVSFRVNPVPNPNNGTPMQYVVRVSSNQDGSGSVITSGLLNSTQWSVPDGVLQDGSTYWVSAESYDSSGGYYSNFGAPTSFRIDTRQGQNRTQSYDNVGDAQVDLATGNLETSNATHSTAALGGSIGLGLNYNSPMKSRAGLIGKYWNVSQNYDFNSGPPSTTATTTRVDENVDFDWGSGSPASGVSGSWFYAQWSGYFLAPTTGSYTFGGSNDDNMQVLVNDQSVYNQGCYGQSPCFGNSVTLKAGSLTKITINYLQGPGLDYAHLYVNTPIGQQIVPQTWLQTGIRQYNPSQGLVGRYYTDDGTHNLNATGITPYLTRTDSLLSFNWNGSPVIPTTPGNYYMVRWSGYVTVPVSGTYNFGASSDDGTVITVNNTTVESNWNPGGFSAVNYGNSVSLTAGVSVPITVDYFQVNGPSYMYLYAKGPVDEQVVPSTWLSTKAETLPLGWNLSINPTGNVGYDYLKINSNNLILVDSTGDNHIYDWNGSGYTPRVNEYGTIVHNYDNTYTYQDSSGNTYVFDSGGLLKSMTTPTDDRHPAALKYVYTGTPAHLTQIIDGVNSARNMTLYYSGDSHCVNPPTGFDANAPNGMICAFITNDGRTTSLFYLNGNLSRFSQPGNDNSDYQYDNFNRIIGMRDSMANDLISAGLLTSDGTELTSVAYDDIGRVSNVTLPAATKGAARQNQSFNYFGSQPKIPLTRYFNSSSSEHMSTTNTPSSGYAFDASLGYLIPSHLPSTQALYSCIKGTDEFSSLDQNCEGATTYEGIIGYVYNAIPQNASVSQLERCVTTAGEKYDVAIAIGSADCNGASVDKQLGYISTDNSNLVNAYSEEHIAGETEPLGYDRHIEYDSLYRTTKDVQQDGNFSSSVWDINKDILYATINSEGLLSSTVYDDVDRAVTEYGPAPQNWFSKTTDQFGHTNYVPLSQYSSQVPRSDSTYDQNISGLAVSYMNVTEPTVNNTLNVGSSMTQGQSLWSADRRFHLIFQYDGNLVIYGPNGASIWSTSTTGAKVANSFTLQADGNFVGYQNAGVSVWNSETGDQGSNVSLVLQNYGNLELIKSGIVVWQSYSGGYSASKSGTASLTGAPLLHSTGINTDGTFTKDFGVNTSPISNITTNWGFDATGKLRLPSTGSWNFRVASDNGVRLYIDNVLVIDDWNDGPYRSHPTYSYNNIQANKPLDFHIQYYHNTGDANFGLYITPPGGVETNQVQSYISPNYGLVTSSIKYDSTEGNAASITNYGPNPELGLANSTTFDPTGANLVSNATYEAPGSGSFLRLTSKTLPAGTTTKYSYYSATDTVSNPCIPGSSAAMQAGMLRYKTTLDPDGNGPNTGITTESIYDDSGKIVATRKTTEAWTCNSYDARERLVSTKVPSINGSPTRTITYNYAVNHNPLIVSTTDNTGTITVTSDLNGREVSYTDTKGNTTNSTYDVVGNIVTKTGPMGRLGYTYDIYDRLSDYQINGKQAAHINYDSYNQITNITYPLASQMRVDYSHDALDKLNGISYTLGDGKTKVSDSVVRSQSGDVISGLDNGVGESYKYDSSGKLVSANIGKNTFTYNYGQPAKGACKQPYGNPNAYKDSDRTSKTVNGVMTTYCYNYADQLISSSDNAIAVPVYDSHGNIIQLGSGNSMTKFTYDGTDRNTSISDMATGINVKYTIDSSGRIVNRLFKQGNNTQNQFFGYTSSTDTPDFVTDSKNKVTLIHYQLPGNIDLAVSPSATISTSQTYSLPNIHGDIVATTNNQGKLTGTYITGPFGEYIAGQKSPNNSTYDASNGYLGQYDKLTESAMKLQPQQMGARVYIPSLGDFTSVDPVEGGNPNSYVYPPDPVNQNDISGKCPMCIILVYELCAAAAIYGPEIINSVTGSPEASVSPYRVGVEGEKFISENLGIARNFKTYVGHDGKGTIPDFVLKGNKGFIESKNVKSLSYTKQIKRQVYAASKKNTKLTIYTRRRTKISGPLQHQINIGNIKHKYFSW